MSFFLKAYVALDGQTTTQAFEGLRQLLVKWSETCGPLDVRLGDDEPVGPPVASAEAMQLMSHAEGYMAMGAQVTCEVTADRPPPGSGRSEPDSAQLSLWLTEPIGVGVVEQVLRDALAWCATQRVICIFAGAEDENRHHLFARISLPRGSIESFVGRNHRKVVPGLFWFNVWQTDWLGERGVDTGTLPDGWEVHEQDGGNPKYFIATGRFPWTEWEAHVSAAEHWADETPGVFSMRAMMASKPDRLNELSALRFIRQWK